MHIWAWRCLWSSLTYFYCHIHTWTDRHIGWRKCFFSSVDHVPFLHLGVTTHMLRVRIGSMGNRGWQETLGKIWRVQEGECACCHHCWLIPAPAQPLPAARALGSRPRKRRLRRHLPPSLSPADVVAEGPTILLLPHSNWGLQGEAM